MPTAIVTSLSSIAGLLYCLWWYPRRHHGVWYVPMASRVVGCAGRRVLEGHFASLYAADHALYALPLGLLLASPIAIVESIVGRPSIHPASVLFTVPYLAVCSALVVETARRLAAEAGVSGRRLWAVQGAAAVIAVAPLLEWGHLEDTFALAGVLVALRCAQAERWGRAALLLSVAIACKQWAVMLVPLLAFAAPTGRRLRTALLSVALPAAVAALMTAADPHDALRAFLSPALQVRGYPGHPGVLATWLGSHSSQVDRACATGAACLLGWRLSTRARSGELLMCAAAILLVRPVFETTSYSYYWSPGLLILTIAVIASPVAKRAQAVVMAFLAAVWTFPESNDSTNFLWCAGDLLILAILLALSFGRRDVTIRLPASRDVHRARRAPLPVPGHLGPAPAACTM